MASPQEAPNEPSDDDVTSLILEGGPYGCDESFDIEKLKTCGSKVEELECNLYSTEMADSIACYCPNLETLTLYTSEFSERESYFGQNFLEENATSYDVNDENDERSSPYVQALSSLFRKLMKLKSLTIYGERDHYPYDLLYSLPQSMEEISLIILCRNKHSFGHSFYLQKFTNLRKFAVIAHTVSKNALSGIETLNNLVHLDFSGISRGVHISNIKKIKNFTKLNTLKIPYCKIDDTLLMEIISKNRDLEKLNISFMPNITDASVQAASSLPKLRVLDVSHLRSITLMSVNHMPSLEKLDCGFCKCVKDEGLRRVLQMSPNLRKLDVSYSSITGAFFQNTATAVNQRAEKIKLFVSTSFEYDDIEFEDDASLMVMDFPWRRQLATRKMFHETPDDDDDYYDRLYSHGYSSGLSEPEDDD